MTSSKDLQILLVVSFLALNSLSVSSLRLLLDLGFLNDFVEGKEKVRRTKLKLVEGVSYLFFPPDKSYYRSKLRTQPINVLDLHCKPCGRSG